MARAALAVTIAVALTAGPDLPLRDVPRDPGPAVTLEIGRPTRALPVALPPPTAGRPSAEPPELVLWRLVVPPEPLPEPPPPLEPEPLPPAATAPERPPDRAPAPAWPSSLEPCGGDLPPCYVKARESGGNYSAKNPTSSASGAWQFLDSTWNGFAGFARAMDAPPAVQDERARQLWAGGAGCSHWSAC